MVPLSGPPSILVVEDEALLRLVTVDVLEEAGYSVIEAETGEQEVNAIIGGAKIAGLVTDVQTPGDTDGFELARITRELYPKAAILVVSGRARPVAGDLLPGAKFLGKPYTAMAVLDALNDLIGRDPDRSNALD